MYQCCYTTLLLVALGLPHGTTATATPPNIVIILADDLGWNDVGFHGSDQIPTPNIDALAFSGLVLRDYYTQPICTPARAALLTGRHPIHNGMHHDVIYAPQPWGLPLRERLLPQHLKARGYVTRGVGKWHLGFFRAAYTPTQRGFDSFFGTWLGHGNHFSHMAYEGDPGYDLHRGLNTSWEGRGRYSADLFTDEAEAIIQDHDVERPLFLYLSHTAPHAPLQAPQGAIDKLQHIPLGKRRTFAAMVAKVDESVGRVTAALKERNMLNNSIILFLTDNGGATNGYNGNVASNWPLRGCKDTLWEGGVRGVGMIWSPLLASKPRVHRGLVNVQDWLPTLLTAVGGDDDDQEGLEGLDGVSQWAALRGEAPPPYTTMLHNIDPHRHIAALRHGDWKIVKGRVYSGHYDGWGEEQRTMAPYSVEAVQKSLAGRALRHTGAPLPSARTLAALRRATTLRCVSHNKKRRQKMEACEPHLAACLFNIAEDPCELYNVAASHPKLVARLTAELESFELAPTNNRRADPRSLPHLWNQTWTTWQDLLDRE